MPDTLLASGQAIYWIGAVMLIMARVGFIIYFMPGVGEQAVPVRVRAMIVLVFSISLAVTGVVEMPVLSSLGEFFRYLALEASIGLFFGLLLRLSIWMLSITGTIIAQVIGLSQMLGMPWKQRRRRSRPTCWRSQARRSFSVWIIMSASLSAWFHSMARYRPGRST